MSLLCIGGDRCQVKNVRQCVDQIDEVGLVERWIEDIIRSHGGIMSCLKTYGSRTVSFVVEALEHC